MKSYNQCILLAALAALSYSGCNEWQDLKSNSNYQEACLNSGGTFLNNRCSCPDENHNPCDEGVICVKQKDNDKEKYVCAGRTGESFEKMCESSGGNYIKNEENNEERCQCNNEICDNGVICNQELKTCAGRTGNSFEKMCISSGGKYITGNYCKCGNDRGSGNVNACDEGVLCISSNGSIQCAGHPVNNFSNCQNGQSICLNNDIYTCNNSFWIYDRKCKTGCNENYLCKDECEKSWTFQCGTDANGNFNDKRYECVEHTFLDVDNQPQINKQLKLVETCEFGCFESKLGKDCYVSYISEREKSLIQYIQSIAEIDKDYCTAMKCDADLKNEIAVQVNKCNEKYSQCQLNNCMDTFLPCGRDNNGNYLCLTSRIEEPAIKDCCTQDKFDEYNECKTNSKHCDDKKTECESLAYDIYKSKSSCVTDTCPFLSEEVIFVLYAVMNSLYSSHEITNDCIDALENCLKNGNNIQNMKECIMADHACHFNDSTSKANNCAEQASACMESCHQENNTDICSTLCVDDSSCIQACEEVTYCQSLCKQTAISCLETFENWIIEKTVPILNKLLKLSVNNGAGEDVHRELAFNHCSADVEMSCSCTLLDEKCLADKDYCLKERSSCSIYLNARQNAEKQYEQCNDGAYCKLCDSESIDAGGLACIYNRLDTSIGYQYKCSEDGLWKENTDSFCAVTDSKNITRNVSCQFTSETYDMDSRSECGECLNGDIQCVESNGIVQLQQCNNGKYEKLKECNNVSCMYRGPIYNLSNEINNPTSDAEKEKELILNDRRNWTCGICKDGSEYTVEIKGLCGDNATTFKSFVTAMLVGADVCDKDCVAKTKSCMSDPCANSVNCSEPDKDHYKQTTYDAYLKVAKCTLKPVENLHSGNAQSEYQNLTSDQCYTNPELKNYYDKDKNCEQACADYSQTNTTNPFSKCVTQCDEQRATCGSSKTCTDQWNACIGGTLQEDMSWAGGCADKLRPCYECKRNALKSYYEDCHKTFDACRAAHQTHISCLQSGIDFACLQNAKYIEGGCINNIHDAEETHGIDQFFEYKPTAGVVKYHFPCVNGRWEIDPNLKNE